MSQQPSPSTKQPYGVARVIRVWDLSRSTFYARRIRRDQPPAPRRRGRPPVLDDDALLTQIRVVIAESPFTGEGHRKIWARLRAVKHVRTSKRRALRVMRAAGLLAPARQPEPVVARPHDGTIITERPNVMWGTDATATVTLLDGQVMIFAAIDHCTAECVGIHAAIHGDRFEALEPLRQGVRAHFGAIGAAVAAGLSVRHDHGSVYPERRLPQGVRVSRHDALARLRPATRGERVHRAIFPHVERTAAVGSALQGRRRPQTGPPGFQGDVQPGVVDRATRLSIAGAGASGICCQARGLITLNALSKTRGPVHPEGNRQGQSAVDPLQTGHRHGAAVEVSGRPNPNVGHGTPRRQGTTRVARLCPSERSRLVLRALYSRASRESTPDIPPAR